MTLIMPSKGESIADIRKKLDAMDRSTFGMSLDPPRSGKRELNECGQTEKGRFDYGNTCAAGGDRRPALPEGRVYSDRYGMVFKAGNEKVVEGARLLSDEKWNTLPVETLPFGARLEANEEILKTKPINKVVSGEEPFREGYVTKIFRDADGKLHVVDGHHRVAMYHALKKDMPVRIIDAKTTEKLLAEQRAEQASALVDILSKPENAEGFTVDPIHFKSPSDGIMVSLNSEQTTISADDIASGKADKALGDWFDKYGGQLSGTDKSKHIGGWLDTGDNSFYLDVATRYAPGDEAKALEAAREARQLAVFNMSTFNDTFVVYDAGDPRKPEDYDTKFSKWLASKGLSEPDYSFGRTTVRSLHCKEIANATRALPVSGGINDQRAVHRRDEGDGSQGARAEGRHEAGSASERALNPCGQAANGTFAPGNSCAASGAIAAAASPPSPLPPPPPPPPQPEAATADGESPGHFGDQEAADAAKAIFVDGVKPSEYLKAKYGWSGSPSDIDARLVDAVNSLNEGDARREAVAGAVCGIGRAVRDFPEIKNVSIRITTSKDEGDSAEAMFRAAWQSKVGEGPTAISQDELDAAATEARRAASAPIAHYNAQTDTIAVLVDNVPVAAKLEAIYIAGTFASPSLLHSGYHEASHAAHAAKIRREASIAGPFPLDEATTNRYLGQRDARIAIAAMELLAVPEKYKLSTPFSGKTTNEIQDGITGEIERKISRYAASAPAESIAEYMTGVALGGINRDPAVEEFLSACGMPPVPPSPPGKYPATDLSRRVRDVGFTLSKGATQ